MVHGLWTHVTDVSRLVTASISVKTSSCNRLLLHTETESNCLRRGFCELTQIMPLVLSPNTLVRLPWTDPSVAPGADIKPSSTKYIKISLFSLCISLRPVAMPFYPSFFKVFITLTPSVLFSLVSASTCYFPNGTAILDDTYQPCRSNTTYSMCCALKNRISYTTDQCMPSGLCFNSCLQDGSCNDSDGSGTYWRESCTDPTWNSPSCLKGVCTNSSVRLLNLK